MFNLTKTFSTVVPNPSGPNQVSTAPPKTKEQIKIETLMSQWPEYLRNPPRGYVDLELAKEIYQDLYKFHQGDRKTQGPYDVPLEYSNKFTQQVNSVKTTDAVAAYLKEFEGFLPDHYIMNRFKYSAAVTGEKSKEFFEVILPQAKKIILNADRQSASHLATGVEVGTWLNLVDKEFWDMLEFKLVNERLYRYLTLSEAASVAYHLALGGRANKALMMQLEMHFIKHRKALSLDAKTKRLVEGAFSIVGGSETLFAALNDPNIEVPAVDAKIPKMDRVVGGDPKRARISHGTHHEKKQLSHE